MNTKTRDEIILLPSHIKVYNFVVAYVKKHIVSPEAREIAKGVKLEDRQVHRLVDDLCVLGYLSKRKYFKRSIRVEKQLK